MPKVKYFSHASMPGTFVLIGRWEFCSHDGQDGLEAPGNQHQKPFLMYKSYKENAKSTFKLFLMNSLIANKGNNVGIGS